MSVGSHYWLVLLMLVLIFSITSTVLADEPNVGLLRVDSFLVPSEVAPNTAFNATIDVIYATHSRPPNATIRAAIYIGELNFSDPIWQSSPVVVPIAGDQLWNVTLTSPSTLGYFNLTAAAYFLDQGSWRFFNNSVNGPSFKQVSIRIGNTANLNVDLGIAGISIAVNNQTITTSANGNIQISLFLGENYDVLVAPFKDFGNSTRIVFNGWRNGSNQTERRILLDGDTILVGSYRRQYKLIVNSPVAPYSDWYDAGSIVEVHTVSSFPMNSPLNLLGLQYNFVGWSGDIKAATPDLNVTMNTPKTLIADFSPNYSILIIPAILTLGGIGAVILTIRKLKTASSTKMAEDSQPCEVCGKPTEKDWTHCMHCGSKLEPQKST